MDSKVFEKSAAERSAVGSSGNVGGTGSGLGGGSVIGRE